jgi:hypothetical protein
MSAPVISAVVPPVLPRQRIAEGDSASPSLGRQSLPLPSLIPGRASRLIYGLAAVDDRGRVADRIVMRALGWQAGLRLAIAEAGGVLTVRADPHGTCAVTGQGYLRLPAVLRHRCALAAGDRVLLAADPAQSRLTVYPPAALDQALAQPADTTGGEPA